MAKKQYLDTRGLSTFWGKIKGYVDVPKISVAANDKFLSLTNKLVGATVTLRYDQATKQIGLYGKDTSTPVSTIDASDFVKDGILESVELTEANELVFTWNADSGKTATTIALNKFLDNVNFDGANLKLNTLPTVTDYTAPKNGDSLDTAIANLASGLKKAMQDVATHEQTLDKHLQVLNILSETKVEWFVIPITGAVYEDILSGVKDYITIPYDISKLIEGDSRLKTGQAGIKLEVADEASVNAVYLPFTLVSQVYILPSFDDLVIRGTSLSSGKAYDIRYHVNVDAKTNYIKLEKAGASASLPWLEINTQENIYDSLYSLKPGTGFSIQLENIRADAEMVKYCGLKVTDRHGNIWSALWGYIMDDRTEYYASYFDFCGKRYSMHFIGDMLIFTNCEIDLSDYANKTNVETALSGKVDNATFKAHKNTYETFKTNTEVALNSKADIANTYNKAEVDAKLTGMVKIQKLTQEEYDALQTKDENVLYAIIER